MNPSAVTATIGRQLRSRFRTPAFWASAALPVVVIGVILYQAGRATDSPAMTMFLAVLSALWIGGSGCIREVVDERRLVQREPHLSLVAYGLAKILHAGLLAMGQSLVLTAGVLSSGVVSLPLTLLWGLLFLSTFAGSVMALLASSLCDEAATALAWFPLLLVPQVVFGGFLFPYADTRPFALDQATGSVIEMPAALVRPAVTSTFLQVLGRLAVSRWALEAYAAEAYHRDLADAEALQEAVKVNFFVPLTLSQEPVGTRLIERASGSRPGSDGRLLDTARSRYWAVLVAFCAAETVLFFVVLPLRDPRRVAGR